MYGEGRLASESVQQGQLGTPVQLREIDYVACPNNSTAYFPSEETVYPSTDQPTETIVTSHSYTFHSGTCQIQEQTTTTVTKRVPFGEAQTGRQTDR